MKFAAVLLIALVASTAIAGCAKKSDPTTTTPTGTGGGTTTSGTGGTTPTGGSGTNGTQAPTPQVIFNNTISWVNGNPQAEQTFTVPVGYTSLSIVVEKFVSIDAGLAAINNHPQPPVAAKGEGGIYTVTPGTTGTVSYVKKCASQIAATAAGTEICAGGSSSVSNAASGEWKLGGGGVGQNARARVIVTAS